MNEDPNHPILERPWEFEITDLRYHTGLDGTKSFLDLTLRRREDVRRLRFWEPRDLTIDTGFPMSTGGMQILDVRGRGLDGLGVRVSDFEASHGAIEFWAKDVVDLDEEPIPNHALPADAPKGPRR